MNSFWQGKRVLVTGHTGFKGSWLSLWLRELGAQVFGYALAPETRPALFDQLELGKATDHFIGDVRDDILIAERVNAVQPDVVFHLAAQPLVRQSYREPLLTWQTNALGTVNLLEALRRRDRLCAVVIVTTDKVYENREWLYAYRETDRLGGHDPYSSSKAAAELAVASWRSSFFGNGSLVRIASARAGNVIGGGDWSEDRIIPDLVRALAANVAIPVRNPRAVRPWQHVLESLTGYMRLAQLLHESTVPALQDGFNFGPQAADFRTVRELVETALQHWQGSWFDASEPNAPHEAGMLGLTIEKARSVLSWAPKWHFEDAVRETLRWYQRVHEGHAPRDIALDQIWQYSAA